MILPEVGGAGQERLRKSRVLLVGAGGLGSPVALYLAAAGVGQLVIVDGDLVEMSNLHRQILHFTSNLGEPKVSSAQEKITALNAGVKVWAKKKRFSLANAGALLKGCHAALDGSDNFETRFSLNEACVRQGVPLIWGAVMRWEGQLMTVLPGKTACYECLFPEPPDPAVGQSCSQGGILGSVAGGVGALMAGEAIKVLLNLDESRLLAGRFWSVDLLTMRVRERSVDRRRGCRVCGQLTKKR